MGGSYCVKKKKGMSLVQQAYNFIKCNVGLWKLMFGIISLYSGELLSEMLVTNQSTAVRFEDEFTA